MTGNQKIALTVIVSTLVAGLLFPVAGLPIAIAAFFTLMLASFGINQILEWRKASKAEETPDNTEKPQTNNDNTPDNNLDNNPDNNLSNNNTNQNKNKSANDENVNEKNSKNKSKPNKNKNKNLGSDSNENQNQDKDQDKENQDPKKSKNQTKTKNTKNTKKTKSLAQTDSSSDSDSSGYDSDSESSEYDSEEKFSSSDSDSNNSNSDSGSESEPEDNAQKQQEAQRQLAAKKQANLETLAIMLRDSGVTHNDLADPAHIAQLIEDNYGKESINTIKQNILPEIAGRRLTDTQQDHQVIRDILKRAISLYSRAPAQAPLNESEQEAAALIQLKTLAQQAGINNANKQNAVAMLHDKNTLKEAISLASIFLGYEIKRLNNSREAFLHAIDIAINAVDAPDASSRSSGADPADKLPSKDEALILLKNLAMHAGINEHNVHNAHYIFSQKPQPEAEHAYKLVQIILADSTQSLSQPLFIDTIRHAISTPTVNSNPHLKGARPLPQPPVQQQQQQQPPVQPPLPRFLSSASLSLVNLGQSFRQSFRPAPPIIKPQGGNPPSPPSPTALGSKSRKITPPAQRTIPIPCAQTAANELYPYLKPFISTKETLRCCKDETSTREYIQSLAMHYGITQLTSDYCRHNNYSKADVYQTVFPLILDIVKSEAHNASQKAKQKSSETNSSPISLDGSTAGEKRVSLSAPSLSSAAASSSETKSSGMSAPALVFSMPTPPSPPSPSSASSAPRKMSASGSSASPTPLASFIQEQQRNSLFKEAELVKLLKVQHVILQYAKHQKVTNIEAWKEGLYNVITTKATHGYAPETSRRYPRYLRIVGDNASEKAFIDALANVFADSTTNQPPQIFNERMQTICMTAIREFSGFEQEGEIQSLVAELSAPKIKTSIR